MKLSRLAMVTHDGGKTWSLHRIAMTTHNPSVPGTSTLICDRQVGELFDNGDDALATAKVAMAPEPVSKPSGAECEAHGLIKPCWRCARRAQGVSPTR